MNTRPNSNAVSAVKWNKDLAGNPVKIKTFNTAPIDITIEQLKELYRLLYPIIVADFVHRGDLDTFTRTIKEDLDTKVKVFNSKLDTFVSDYNSHEHITTEKGLVTTSSPTPRLTSTPVFQTWVTASSEVLPPTMAESLILNTSDEYINIQHRTTTPVSGLNGLQAPQMKKLLSNTAKRYPFDATDSLFGLTEDKILENTNFTNNIPL